MSRRPVSVVRPYHSKILDAQKDHEGTPALAKLFARLSGFLSVPVFAPVSRIGLAGWTLRLKEVALPKDAKVFPLHEAELDRRAELLKKLRAAIA